MDEARQLNVNGWVRNLPDGDVELEAAGEKEDLEKLLVRVRQGPILSRVDQVLSDWREGEAPSEGSSWGVEYRF